MKLVLATGVIWVYSRDKNGNMPLSCDKLSPLERLRLRASGVAHFMERCTSRRAAWEEEAGARFLSGLPRRDAAVVRASRTKIL